METSAFDFELPPELIAQKPVRPRDASRLMVVDRQKKTWEHRRFFEIGEYLSPGDVLVVNESKVLRARLLARKKTGGKVEILFVRFLGAWWECLLSPSSRIRPGQEIVLIKDPQYRWVVQERLPETWLLQPLFAADESFFDHFGEVPLPPYIREKDITPDEYQTVYAREWGSVAAPTAGFHFTPELLKAIRAKGVMIIPVVLHVGPGTFRPVRVEKVEQHTMHRERFRLGAEEAEAILEARRRGGRVVAVGTTAVRVLETVWQKFGTLKGLEGETELFIYPGFSFGITDAFITNFHLPRSTLFMLVCAFGGMDLVKRAYQEAIKERYRFYSFGDAMLLL